MNDWELPRSLTVAGKAYPIRTDFRVVLDILKAMEDPELDGLGKNMVMVRLLFPDYRDIPQTAIPAAIDAAMGFIDHGAKSGKSGHTRLMDWEQDAPYIIPAINEVAHADVRAIPELHWWTFLSYFMEIKESTFSTILHIRQKRSKGKKLDKWEQEYFRDNQEAIILKSKQSEEEKAYWDKWL